MHDVNQVHDADPALPPPPAQDRSITREHGRGLQIVQALGTAWGSRPTGATRGRTSWSELTAA